MERLQKVIAEAGICSRRKAEQLILEGKVKVNGKIVDTLGVKVSGLDDITVNGQRLEKEQKVYYILYKPKGCLSTVSDDKDRRTVMDYLPKGQRIYPVGRLDYDTSGLLLATNDGTFTNAMIHPRYHLPKTYEVNIDGMLDDEAIKTIRKGFEYEGEKFAPAKIVIKNRDYTRNRMQLVLILREGKNHQVKKMMEAFGCRVRKLHRSRFGHISLEGMRPGEYKKLKSYDVKKLLAAAREGNEE
ncbi:MAG: rRNA pseudouridine synthase [Erysipelotrichaceae bacterium]|nr:rRNA pseudouridine synthase [Erysipelotrichaceae bacterium]